MTSNIGSAKKVAITAISATLYAIFFFLSALIAVPNFTILYLPAILLGIFPLWFGWSGLIGCMIGAFIGGAFIEGLGFLAIFESVTAFIIYSLNWLLIPSKVTERKEKRDLLILIGAYAVSLFAGTSYILWQYTVLPALFTAKVAEAILLPTYGLNLTIEAIICPILVRTLSPKLRSWGVCSLTFNEWRAKRKKPALIKP